MLGKKKLEIMPGLELAYAEKKPALAKQDLTLLFVPGITFSSEVFCHQLDGLSDQYRVIALDPRSQGDSSISDTGNDYLTHANDLKLFIEQLELDNIILIGWSFGAISTWQYSTIDQQHLAAHICIDTPLELISANEDKGVWVEAKIAELGTIYHTLRSADGQAQFIKDYAQHVMVERELSDTELDWLAGLSLRTPYTIAASLLASGLFSNCLEQAQTLEQSLPSRFYISHHWSEIATQYLARELPKSSVSILGGHMMFWEYPQQFNSDLKTFLQSL